MSELDPIAKYRNRPRLTITCCGTKDAPHKLLHVAVYSRHEDGTWLPQLSGTRGSIPYQLLETGMRAEANQFDLPCPNHRCTYRFRADSRQVATLFNAFVERGKREATLSLLDLALRYPGVSES